MNYLIKVYHFFNRIFVFTTGNIAIGPFFSFQARFLIQVCDFFSSFPIKIVRMMETNKTSTKPLSDSVAFHLDIRGRYMYMIYNYYSKICFNAKRILKFKITPPLQVTKQLEKCLNLSEPQTTDERGYKCNPDALRFQA